MLGNMQTESSINPGLWDKHHADGTPIISEALGLTQWTPSTNYTNWAASRGIPYYNMDSQLSMIKHELVDGGQWYNSNHVMTFKQFEKSNDTPYNLAMIFLSHYERPLNSNQPARGTQAEYWYNLLNPDTVNSEPPALRKSKPFKTRKPRYYIGG
jgi:hypothetical protein